MQNIIGTRLKQLRAKRGLTQKQLAELTEINYRHYQNIESGTVDLKISTIIKLSVLLGLPSTELCGVLRPFDEGTFTCGQCPILKEIGVGVIVLTSKFEVCYTNLYAQQILKIDVNDSAFAQVSKSIIHPAGFENVKGTYVREISNTCIAVVSPITDAEGNPDAYVIMLTPTSKIS